jgi:hypothetical protein
MSALQTTASEKRLRRLRRTVTLTAAWLGLQGLVAVVLNERLAQILGLRFDPMQSLLLRQYGLALLVLALFVRKAVEHPLRQALAVDLLLMMLVGRIFFTLSFRLTVDTLLPMEWLGLLVHLGLASCLGLWRTRSGEVEKQGGALISRPAADLARDLGRWAAGKGPRPELGLGDLEAASPATEASSSAPGPAFVPPPPKPAQEAPPTDKPKPKSQALPHMD